MSNKTGLGIQIKEIKEVSFHNKVTEELVKDFDSNNLNVKLNFTVLSNQVEGSIALTINVIFKYNVGGKFRDILLFSTCTVFKFSNYENSEEIRLEETKVFIADKLMQFLLNLAIGATRGMMSYKNASLPIDLVMPIIDLSPLFPDRTNANDAANSSLKTAKEPISRK